jgi:peptidyl-dipeptidase Dcp
MENWFSERDSKKTFAFHFETNEVIPDDLLDRIGKLKLYMSGFMGTIQVQYGLMDMTLHSSIPPTSIEELDKLVVDVCNKYSLFELTQQNRLHASFSHIFD